MRTASRALAVLMVVVAGCATNPGSTPADHASAPGGRTSSPGGAAGAKPMAMISPRPAGDAGLRPLPARPARCALPPEDRDDLRASDVPTAWRTLWIDRARGAVDLLAVAADGTLWATFRTEKQRGSALEIRDDRVRRWDGEAWRTFEIPPLPDRGPQPVVALAATSAGQAWVFGNSNDRKGGDTTGFVGTYEGGRWRSETLAKPAADAIGWGYTATQPVGADRMWTVNGRVGLLWTGREWQRYPLPVEAGALSAYDDQVWAVTGAYGRRPAAMRWEQGGWRLIGVPVLETPDHDVAGSALRDVGVIGPDDVWAVGGVTWLMEHEYDDENEPLERGRPVALHWNGRSWTCHWGPPGSSRERSAGRITTFGQAEPDGRGGLWVVGRGDLLWHLSEGRWTRHRIPAPAGYVARVSALALRPGTGQVYAAGSVTSKKESPFAVSHAAVWRAG
ncbi:hypothetical protein [Microbispora sp. CSR-4]|uniref:hypothetical protein n=1 Tax=Microbispora sp. CSR-4 TaxID=2592813 RepID=UPI0011C758E0|nr:hypothetical protein [Microbispora sp. CSR-4]